MPITIAIHVRGRGPVNNGDWEGDNLVQCFEGRIRAGRVEAFVNDLWISSFGRKADKEFLFLFVPNMTLTEARPFEGRRRGKVDWRAFFNAGQVARILDRNQAFPPQRPALMVKAKVLAGPDHGLPRD